MSRQIRTNTTLEITGMEALLKQYLDKLALTSSDADLIISKMKPLKLKKNEVFLENGKVCKRIGVLISGMLCAYYDNEKEEIISRFFYSPVNQLVTSFESFKYRTNANETIKALEDSFLFYFLRDDLYDLYDKIPQMNTLGRELAEESYIQALNRIHSIQAVSIQEKFDKFCELHPDLLTRVQRQHIASYLGMHRNKISLFFKNMNFAT